MLDINFIRENKQIILDAVKNKGMSKIVDIEELLKIDEQRRDLILKRDELRAKRNEISDKIGSAPAEGRKSLIEEATKIKEEVKKCEEDLDKILPRYEEIMLKVPTPPSVDTPLGFGEENNKEVTKWGEIGLDKFDFKPKDYMTLAKELDLIDFDRGAKVSGYRGYYVKNELVLMQMGLMMHALTKLISKGFTPMIPPTIVREFALFGSGYFAGKTFNPEVDEIYKLATRDKDEDGKEQGEDKFLIGTAEPSLLAYYSGEVLDEKVLPMKICGFSQCYRSEIGSYGRDTRGIYRVHEFMKVEQVAIMPVNEELADKIHEEFIGISKELHEDIGIPYRQIQMCTGELSTGKYKQYDMETWVPSMSEGERYGWAETGSASNFLDWQSRRLNVRYKTKDNETKHVYMLNNTAIPSPRFLISILENYQQKDGSVLVPKVLQQYVGKEVIEPKK